MRLTIVSPQALALMLLAVFVFFSARVEESQTEAELDEEELVRIRFFARIYES